MALYRTGTASMDAQGVITGNNTKWRDPLTLIRTGATIVFLSQPVIKLAVISEIVSDTELRAISTDGDAVPEGNYVILLNDSLTVDGMAQDVAETLRYYQGKETEIEEAIEFFKNFDLNGLKELVKQATDASNEAKNSAAAALASQQAASQSEANALGSEAAAAASEEAALQSEQSALAHADEAKEQVTLAANQVTLATEQAERAKGYADSLDVNNIMKRDNNLSDLADRAQAWLNVRPVGPTPLTSEPVGDYDAATKKWVENLVGSGGAGGPNLNGVMNYGVGTLVLWQSRSFIPSYLLPLDGQILNRADYPDLWAHAESTGLIVPETEWSGQVINRTKFSAGDGSTTFRVPDVNGVQINSIAGPYFRGDSGQGHRNGSVYEGTLPNIHGQFATRVPNGHSAFTNGAFNGTANIPPGNPNYNADTSAIFTDLGSYGYEFNASNYNPTYGRYGSVEVNPNHFYGVWCIRATGNFTAANTKFGVINAVNGTPSQGTIINGGSVESNVIFNDNPGSNFGALMFASASWGGSVHLHNRLYTANGSQYTETTLRSDGTFIMPKAAQCTYLNIDRPHEGGEWKLRIAGRENNDLVIEDPANKPAFGFIQVLHINWYNERMRFGPVRGGGSDINHVQLSIVYDGGITYWDFNRHSSQILTQAGAIIPSGSDKRLKNNIRDYDYSDSLSNIMKITPRMFNWKCDGRSELGFIAQEIELVNPNYVWRNDEGDILNVMDRAIMADVVGAIKTLKKMNGELTGLVYQQKAVISAQEEKLASQEARIAKLEAAISALSAQTIPVLS